jgi:hypothetical protein
VYLGGISHTRYNIVLFGFRVHLEIRWSQNKDDNSMLVKPVEGVQHSLVARKTGMATYVTVLLETRDSAH